MKKTYMTLALTTAVLSTAAPLVHADTDESVTPKQMVDAANAAQKAGVERITEMEAERKNGKIVIEVETVNSEGMEGKIWIDPATNEVIK